MSRVGTALKATAVHQAFELIAMLLSLVLIPVSLARLGQEGYGLYLTGVAWASYLMFSNGGLSAATMILISQAHGVGNAEEIARVVRTARALVLIAALIVMAVSAALFFALSNGSLAAQLKLTHPDAPLLSLVVAAQVVISLLMSPFYDLLIGVGRLQLVSLVQGCGRLAVQLLSLVLLLLNLPVWAVFAASPICLLVSGTVAVFAAKRVEPEALASRPRLEKAQAMLQLRAGAKSLGLHVGGTLMGTAPIFALTAVGGPALVPFYAVPNRIFSVAAGALLSFNALMQPAFGEAWARRDLTWLRDTARALLRQTLALSVGIGAGLIALGPEFVRAWTAGRLSVSTVMVTGIALAGAMQAIVGVMKYMLSGMNRHRAAAASELASGALAMALCWSLARFVSADWVAYGVFAAAIVTSALLMPYELSRYLEARLTPAPSNLRWIALLGLSVVALGWGTRLGLDWLRAPAVLSLGVAALCSGAAFFSILQLGGLVDVLAPLRRARGRHG